MAQLKWFGFRYGWAHFLPSSKNLTQTQIKPNSKWTQTRTHRSLEATLITFYVFQWLFFYQINTLFSVYHSIFLETEELDTAQVNFGNYVTSGTDST